MTQSPVRLSGLHKSFGAHAAVSDFDLEIPKGCIYGLLGPNGSGKTTTIRMIMDILMPDRGAVELFGREPDYAGRSRVGYLPEERGVYEKMKVFDQLVFLGQLRGVSKAAARKRTKDWLERLDLAEWAQKRVRELSKGMQQKVQFVGTVLHEPELLILDEPFSGLDPINQDVLESIVREERARGTTILFSTHLMEQAERLCERVCLISRSRKVLDGDLKELKRKERSGTVAIEFDGATPHQVEAPAARQIEETLSAWPGVAHVGKQGDAWHLSLEAGADTAPVLAASAQSGAPLRRFELLEPSLRELFVRHAGSAGDGDHGNGSQGGAQ